MKKPRRKGDKRDRTKARLIEAAAQIVGEKGWDRTSLAEVAVRAGMTRGAVYGNFKNRDDLFLAIVQSRWKPVIPPYQPGLAFKDRMHVLGKAVAAATPERRAQAIGALSFQLYALTHEDMRRRVARVNAEIYRQAAAAMTESVNRGELPMAPERLVKVLHALTDGLTFLRFLTPELITDDLIIAAFEALAHTRTR
jgi:TetR/AcrR family acrAB operon transcriptional repressor